MATLVLSSTKHRRIYEKLQTYIYGRILIIIYGTGYMNVYMIWKKNKKNFFFKLAVISTFIVVYKRLYSEICQKMLDIRQLT
jgi:hypothetical protein